MSDTGTHTDTDPERDADWVSIAKKAAQLVEQVDLAKVGQHDSPEVAKLSEVVRALESLTAGHDPDTHAVEARRLRKSQLTELLDRVGHTNRVGRVFADGVDDPIKPLEYVPHLEGLPPFDMVVAPDYSPAPGVHGIFVSAKGVISAVVPYPAHKHRWRTLRSRPYEDDQDLVDTVTRYITHPSHPRG